LGYYANKHAQIEHKELAQETILIHRSNRSKVGISPSSFPYPGTAYLATDVGSSGISGSSGLSVSPSISISTASTASTALQRKSRQLQLRLELLANKVIRRPSPTAARLHQERMRINGNAGDTGKGKGSLVMFCGLLH